MTHRLNFLGHHFNSQGACVCTGKCCNDEHYCICSNCKRDYCVADHPPEEPVAKLPTPVKFKAGDKIQPRNNRLGAQYSVGPDRERTVKFVGDTVAVYEYEMSSGATAEKSCTLTHLADSFELVPNFFKVGRSYKRMAGWSIPAQRSDVIERFEVKQVERNGSGSLVAFGRLTVLNAADQWVLRDQYSWDSERWEEDR